MSVSASLPEVLGPGPSARSAPASSLLSSSLSLSSLSSLLAATPKIAASSPAAQQCSAGEGRRGFLLRCKR